jgi:hypothetical protein
LEKGASPTKKARVQPAFNSLQGWPGYRNRQGRSGLDPLDNDAEGGHMAGLFVRRLVTGKLRTRKPIYLVLMAALGLICLSPFTLAILEGLRGDFFPFGAWVALIIPALFGIALLVNLVKSLLHLTEE